MIKGIGTDIIEISRIKKAMKQKGFLDKIFTSKEREMFQAKHYKAESVAANFAAKEAVSKALGTGVRGFKFNEIEILRNDLGKPVVKLSRNIEKKFFSGSYIVHISLSHNQTDAIAYVIIEEGNL